jgi:hypothetical protein
VRAHVGASGELRIELLGASDAGRDALRAIVADLRRDLASVSPHATLSLGSAAGGDPGGDRSPQPGQGGAAPDHGQDRRDPAGDEAGPRPARVHDAGIVRGIRTADPTAAFDIFA